MSNDINENKQRRMKTWVKVAIGVVIVALIAAVAGPFVYINFIKDEPEERLSLDDAPTGTSAEVATSTAATAVTTTEAPVSTQAGADTSATETTIETADAADTVAAPTPSAGADGTYTLTPDSEAGYRVVEVLFGQDTEGVGRTNSVTGSITIAGTQVTAAEFSVDMATLTSDEENRDNKFKGEIMETSEFPTATFVITEPIELGAIPADGEELIATATGDLTLHGVTNPVTLEVAAKKTGSSVAVVGSTDVVFSDYDIDNPSNAVVTTQDHGLVEFLLVAVKS